MNKVNKPSPPFRLFEAVLGGLLGCCRNRSIPPLPRMGILSEHCKDACNRPVSENLQKSRVYSLKGRFRIKSIGVSKNKLFKKTTLIGTSLYLMRRPVVGNCSFKTNILFSLVTSRNRQKLRNRTKHLNQIGRRMCCIASTYLSRTSSSLSRSARTNVTEAT